LSRSQKTLAKYILDSVSRSDVKSTEIVEHSYSSGISSTSTIRYAIKEQTLSARRGGTEYNPYVSPYQHWLLKKYSNPDIENSSVREDLFHASQFIKKHARDMIWRVVAGSWEYQKDGKKIFEELKWSPELQDMYIDALAKAMVVDTSFLVRWSGGSFSVFTSNDVSGSVYISREDRRIEEVYFNYPKLDNAIYRDGKAMDTVIVGFLTQYAPDSFAEPKRKNIGQDTIYRDCVVFQPYPDVHKIFGRPYLEVENETGLQKIYLRSYEFAFIHKGGVNQVVVVPHTGSKSSLKDKVARNVENGLWSRGLVMDVTLKGDKSVNDLVLSKDTAIPELGFDRINSMVSEDAQLTKQRIEGTAETGAMGGKAPVVNEKEDLVRLDSLLVMMDKTIRDVNEVFFGIRGYEEKVFSVDGQTNIMKMPAYDIAFNNIIIVDEDVPDDGSPENGFESQPRRTLPRRGPMRYSNKEVTRPSMPAMGNAVAIKHSVEIDGSSYTVYEGNLFDSIPYYYPETDTFEYYAPEDIEQFTKNPIKRAPIAFMHDDSDVEVALGKNLGFLEIVGYDEEHGQDRTMFYIREDKDKELRENGVIVNDTLKVSPLFHRKVDESGRKRIYLKNGAVIDPRKAKPRAELTGGKTSARKVE